MTGDLRRPEPAVFALGFETEQPTRWRQTRGHIRPAVGLNGAACDLALIVEDQRGIGDAVRQTDEPKQGDDGGLNAALRGALSKLCGGHLLKALFAHSWIVIECSTFVPLPNVNRQ